MTKKKKRKKQIKQPTNPTTALHPGFPCESKNSGCLVCPLFRYCVPNIEEHFPEYKSKSTKWKDANHHIVSHHIAPKIIKRKKDGSVDVLFVGEAPGGTEDRQNEVFVGQVSEQLEEMLEAVKIKSYAVTHSMHCRPPKNDTPSFTVAQLCAPYLADDIKRLKPKIIVPLGTPALQMIFGSHNARITKSAGRLTKVKLFEEQTEFHVFPLFHPAYLLRNPHKVDEYIESFSKLKLFLKNPNSFKDSSDFNTLVVHNKKTLKKAKKILKETKFSITAFDIETNGLSPHFLKSSESLEVPSPSKILSIGFAYDVNSAISFLLSEKIVDKRIINESIRLSIKILTDKRIKKIAHNAKFDVQYIKKIWGVTVKNLCADTMLIHYGGITEEKGTHGLKYLAGKYLNIREYEGNVHSQARDDRQHKRLVNYEKVDPRELGVYNCMDVIVTLRLYKVLKMLVKNKQKELDKSGFAGKKRQLIHMLTQACKALVNVELQGLPIDKKAAKLVKQYYEKLRNEIQFSVLHHPVVARFKRKLLDTYGKTKAGKEKRPFSLNSAAQLTELVYSPEYFDFEPVAPTKTGWEWIRGRTGEKRAGLEEFYDLKDEIPIKYLKTDKEAFAQLKNEQKRKDTSFIANLDDYKSYHKIINTYVHPFIERARCCQGKVYGTFNLHLTDTGRLSSDSPNFQNIPSINGVDVKRMIVSRWGKEGAILSVDYSQIELKLLAILSGDKTMLKAYRNGEDLHKKTALAILNMTEEEYEAMDEKERKKWRTVAKRVNFGIAYGIGADGIVTQLIKEGIYLSKSKDKLKAWHTARKKAREYIQTFYELYPGVAEYINDIHEFVLEHGYIYTLFGRTRELEHAWSDDDNESARALRQAVNFTIQSVASDIMLTSLIIIKKGLKKKFKNVTKMIATIHDALDSDCKIPNLHDVIIYMKEIMENVPKYAAKLWKDSVDWEFFWALPIIAEAEIGVNWRDTVELKDMEGESLQEKIDNAIIESRKTQKKKDKEMKLALRSKQCKAKKFS